MTLPYNYNHYCQYQKEKFKQKVKCNYCNKELNFSSLRRHHNNTCKEIIEFYKKENTKKNETINNLQGSV